MLPSRLRLRLLLPLIAALPACATPTPPSFHCLAVPVLRPALLEGGEPTPALAIRCAPHQPNANE